jgi:hypothetical protein
MYWARNKVVRDLGHTDFWTASLSGLLAVRAHFLRLGLVGRPAGVVIHDNANDSGSEPLPDPGDQIRRIKWVGKCPGCE